MNKFYVIQTTEGYQETIAEFDTKQEALETLMDMAAEYRGINTHFEVAENVSGDLGFDLRTI